MRLLAIRTVSRSHRKRHKALRGVIPRERHLMRVILWV
jgi:hypothetical protein